ncbi:hypothetical protein LOD99_3518 [Oopsacas minuta]|uniref:Uncharacterized protein n=1 Tax=Oopsacas minuta TaxID=111878 RepID=A0AAV7JXD7_9METZ|nr:hypothetical protein LOD99_3518 [Oopsacas minuta]
MGLIVGEIGTFPVFQAFSLANTREECHISCQKIVLENINSKIIKRYTPIESAQEETWRNWKSTNDVQQKEGTKQQDDFTTQFEEDKISRISSKQTL